MIFISEKRIACEGMSEIPHVKQGKGENMELNRCSYMILAILQKKRAVDKIHGATIAEIAALEKISSPNTILKKVKLMESAGLVQPGVKAGKAKTYYLTEKGLGLLPINKEEVEND